MRLVSVVDFIHHFRGISVWMAIIAGSAVIRISANTLMVDCSSPIEGGMTLCR